MTPRPFDKKRDGLVVGEGAGAVLLEEFEHAKARGAEILGEVSGVSSNINGGALILTLIDGITETIRLGLKDAEIDADKMDLVIAHATGTKMGDAIESQAIRNIYGNSPAVIGLKSYMGHTMGSCGVIETIILLYLMKEGIVVPTLNLEEVDERCTGINHSMIKREYSSQIAAVQNFAFGGVNTNLIFKKWQGN
jgi:3-oxoacyl-[acyl-carrier-protein] synthase II